MDPEVAQKASEGAGIRGQEHFHTGCTEGLYACTVHSGVRVARAYHHPPDTGVDQGRHTRRGLFTRVAAGLQGYIQRSLGKEFWFLHRLKGYDFRVRPAKVSVIPLS